MRTLSSHCLCFTRPNHSVPPSDHPIIRQSVHTNIRPTDHAHHTDPTAASGALYEDESAPLAYTLGEVYAMVWSGTRVVFTPDHVLHAVWAAHAPFRGFKQQDAHEVGGWSLCVCRTVGCG